MKCIYGGNFSVYFSGVMDNNDIDRNVNVHECNRLHTYSSEYQHQTSSKLEVDFLKEL